MEQYKHIWKDKDTGELCSLESNFAKSLDESIEDYYQEEGGVVKYYGTLVLHSKTQSYEYIDILEEILTRELAERSDADIADDITASRGDFMRRDMQCSQI